MAFDMYLEKERVFIDTHEEAFFYVINDDDNYPQLNWLWEEFYNGPKITPEVSNDIVHELILLKSNWNDAGIVYVIEKLIPFFSKAYKLNKVIKTHSD